MTRQIKSHRGVGKTTTFALLLYFTVGLVGPAFGIISVTDALAQPPMEEIHDPYESINHKIFWFNDQVDIYVLEPVAKGYDFVTPRQAQKSIANFFSHIRLPAVLVSDLVQFKFGQALEHTTRFVLNTTFGVAGLFDAAEQLGLPDKYEDFGTALAHHGSGPGPYIVLPLLGPSTGRDTIGKAVDYFLDPTFHFKAMGVRSGDAFWVSAGANAVFVVNTRSRLLDAVQAAKDASLDYYGFVRKAFYQIRYEQIHGFPAPEEEYEDYDDEFDDEFEEGLTDQAVGVDQALEVE